uniref:Uncharacterized protein n=1 Tax=Micrurus surinamensis TaxID=129470 RepID=A0A2D4Q4U7_MICSU
MGYQERGGEGKACVLLQLGSVLLINCEYSLAQESPTTGLQYAKQTSGVLSVVCSRMQNHASSGPQKNFSPVPGAQKVRGHYKSSQLQEPLSRPVRFKIEKSTWKP